VRLKDRYRDSRVCIGCGSPVSRIGTAPSVVQFGPEGQVDAWEDRPFRDDWIFDKWWRRVNEYDIGSVCFDVTNAKGMSEPHWTIVYELMCMGDAPDGHRRDHAAVPLLHSETRVEELPEWCYREARPGDAPDVTDFMDKFIEPRQMGMEES
jgi:hypothetical protein